MSTLTVIPPMTDPSGRHWHQPDSRRIIIDDEVAMMSQRDFDQIAEYSCTIPTGVYVGKIWKRNHPTGWFLGWYDHVEGDDMVICWRKIVVV